MSNQGKVRKRVQSKHLLETDIPQITSSSQLNTVIFKQYSGATVGRKFTSLFPGLGYAAGYKVRDDAIAP